tara:strand:+ start:287 stop:484 length:198 start_codon:yes stop_codon:yes gene_type:complete
MKQLKAQDISLIIEMAWCDKTGFKAIEAEYGLCESEVMKLMKNHLKPNSYRVWRKRVNRQAKTYP